MMARTLHTSTLLVALVVLCYASTAHAFGAGNIASSSKIEGQNWRHGDIEDTLLMLLTARAFGGKKFSKLDVKRTYFGNWLRDYSQAVDVGTVKHVSAEAIRLLLWVLGFMTFGYGTGEFEVTSKRLGCYRPEEHIDNPKDYAENEDATQYYEGLRGPIDEETELSVDERTGLKNYIATEDLGITTSAGLIRRLFRKSIELGRRYKDSRDERDFYEALRLLGTGCHCLEDFSAHSNYTELALIELGEREVFPHVGRNTRMRLDGVRHSVYPLITGTFGGVDFFHSVMGEVSDKATQSELQELEGTLQQSQEADPSMLKELLDKLPPGILGGDQKSKADELQANAQAQQMSQLEITPKEPEEFTMQMEEISKQIYPIMEFHDNIMKSISEAIEKIPMLADLVEELQNQISLFVFSLLAPFVMPVIKQVQEELRTGSSEVIQSSRDKQLIVFHDDDSTDPTHSMLSKDHFSNVLNEPAGKVASQVVKWVVPQIVACWDDDDINIRRTNDRIINGVFHHPALREYGDDGANDGRMQMFEVVERWWADLSDDARDDLRNKLSREGVEEGQNHKEGVEDSGHGCGKPLAFPKIATSQSSGAVGGGSGGFGGGRGEGMSGQISEKVSQAAGGGALGSILGGVAGNILGGAFGGDDSEKTTYRQERRDEDEGYTSRVTETAHRPSGYGEDERYGQAQYSRTEYPSGGGREEYQRYEQRSSYGEEGYGYERSSESYPSHGGGYEQRTERRYEQPSGGYQSEYREERVSSSGREYGQYVREDDNEYRRQYEGYGGESYGERPQYGGGRPQYGGQEGYGEQGYGGGAGGYGGGYGSRPDDEYERRTDDYEGRYGGGYGRSGGYGQGGEYEERRW